MPRTKFLPRYPVSVLLTKEERKDAKKAAAIAGKTMTELIKPQFLGQVRFILKQAGVKPAAEEPAGSLLKGPDWIGEVRIDDGGLPTPTEAPTAATSVAQQVVAHHAGLTLEQLQARTGHCHLDPCAGPGCSCACTSCSQTDKPAREAAKRAQPRSQAAPGGAGVQALASGGSQAGAAPPEPTSADLEAAAAEALASLEPTSYLADEEDGS